MNLSEDQKKLIEANRTKAQEIRKQCTAGLASTCKSANVSTQFIRNDNNGSTQCKHAKSLCDGAGPSKICYDSHKNSNVLNYPSEVSIRNPNPKHDTNQAADSALNLGSYQQLSTQQKIEENRKRAIALRALRNKSSEKLSSDSDKSQPLKDSKPIQHLYNKPVHNATCFLMNTKRFYVATKFHGQLIALIKERPSRQYDNTTCRWSLDLEDHDAFIESSQSLKPQVNTLIFTFSWFLIQQRRIVATRNFF